MELCLVILKLNPSAKKALVSVYKLIVSSKEVPSSDEYHQSSLLKHGEYIYYCAEILALTDVNDIQKHCSKEISQTLDKFCKTTELLKCYSPYLTLILLGEFLTRLAKADVLY